MRLVSGLLLVLLLGSLFFLLRTDWTESGEQAPSAVEDSGNERDPATEQPGESDEAESDESGARVEVAPAEPIREAVDALRVRGRVCGRDRRPVAGAAVTATFAHGDGGQAVSLADGSFAVQIPRSPIGSDLLMVVARQDEQVGGLSSYLWESKLKDEVDVGALVLGPGHELLVRVTRDDAPVAGASVVLETLDRMVQFASSVTDVLGEAIFEATPEGSVVVTARSDGASGLVRAVLPGDDRVAVELEADRDHEIRVTDAEDSSPIAGASVSCMLEFRVPARDNPTLLSDSEGNTVRPDPSRSTRTDEEGVAWIPAAGTWDSLGITVKATGYAPHSERGDRLLGDEPVLQVQLTALDLRTVRWPIEAGELPPPEDGTELEVRRVSWMEEWNETDTVPGPARVEGGEVVLPGVDGRANFLATAPDGAIARLHCEAEESEGDPVAFRRSRSIEVTVRDAARAAVEGASVVARNQGNNPLHPPVRTDSNGTCVIPGLYGGLADVMVTAKGHTGRGSFVGSVDLEQGDARIEATLPLLARVRLRFLLDGVRALPPRYRISCRAGCAVEDEDPERGEVVVSTPVEPGSTDPIEFWVRGEGYLSGSAEATLRPGEDEAIAEVELIRGGALVVQVLREPNERVRISLEREDPQTGEVRLMKQRQQIPNGPNGTFLFDRLASGTYRAIDERSKQASAAVQIIEGQPAARVMLDISEAQWVTGTVIAPPDTVLQQVRIVVEGEGIGAKRQTHRFGLNRPGESVVRGDGSFWVRIPGDRPVLIWPWHPRLQPAVEGGDVATTTGLENVELKLDDAAGVVIPAPQLERNVRGVRIGVNDPGSRSMRWFFAAYIDGAIRFGNRPPHGLPAGRHTITIDPGARLAPLVLPDLEVGEGRSEFDPVTFERGSTIRVRILSRADVAPPRISVTAKRLEEPHYMRLITSRGERVVELEGIAAGRHEVVARGTENRGRRLEQVVAADGRTDVELTLDLR